MLISLVFLQGKGHPNVFHNKERGIHCSMHGGGFTSCGPKPELDWIRKLSWWKVRDHHWSPPRARPRWCRGGASSHQNRSMGRRLHRIRRGSKTSMMSGRLARFNQLATYWFLYILQLLESLAWPKGCSQIICLFYPLWLFYCVSWFDYIHFFLNVRLSAQILKNTCHGEGFVFAGNTIR